MKGIKFHELVSKVTFDDNTKPSLWQEILSWVKNNKDIRYVQKKPKKW